jgi:succinate-semialdehyde dehydrogenase/glutarate-semialdehyde dehydrogenase
MTADVTAPGKSYRVTNPATGETLAELPLNSLEELDAALERAKAAQKTWARVPRHERSAQMRRAADLMRAQREELATLLTRENGKTIDQARGEVDTTIRIFQGCAERILAWEEDARFLDSEEGREADVQITHHDPLGVIAAIVPFNFPSELNAWKVAPAIATGNTAVVKPSRLAPLTVIREMELLHQAGVPADVVQIVNGDQVLGRALASHPIPAGVSLTGSTEAGISVATAGAKTLKRVALELGGNDAMIVFADADMDRVVSEAVWGRSLANGQVCCANKRVIVERKAADELVQRLAVSFGGLRLGDPLQPDTGLGPLISGGAAAGVAEQLQHSLDQGARLVCGRPAADRAFFRAAVIVDEDASADVSHDLEIFGPVLDVIPFDTEERAVEIANDSIYGLSGSVFSTDLGRAMRVALQMETGHISINGSGLYRADAVAWGGYKLSGNVREGLGTSLAEFMQTKTLTLRSVLKPS